MREGEFHQIANLNCSNSETTSSSRHFLNNISTLCICLKKKSVENFLLNIKTSARLDIEIYVLKTKTLKMNISISVECP